MFHIDFFELCVARLSTSGINLDVKLSLARNSSQQVMRLMSNAAEIAPERQRHFSLAVTTRCN